MSTIICKQGRFWEIARNCDVLYISVTHAPDCMKGFLYVSDALGGCFPSEAQLFQAVHEHGIVYGIDIDAIRNMAKNKTSNVYVEIAGGNPPLPGIPGRMEILIDVSKKGKPKKLADGRVDYRDISYVVNVTKGTPVVRHVKPVPGQPGTTVFNKAVDPLPAPDVPIAHGRGIVSSPENPDVFIAVINGAIIVHPGGKIDVVDDKVISGDIDYKTGNIMFSGNLHVTGNVRAGFEISVDGDCLIDGNVEDAKVNSLGDIEIAGGAIGSSKGCLRSGGTVKVRHIANFNVQAASDIIAEDVLHCTLSTEGSIKAKTVVGGVIAVWKSVTIDTIGAKAEPKTIIDIGGRNMLLQEKYDLLKHLSTLTVESGACKEKIFELVCNEMDDSGKLNSDSFEFLDGLKKKYGSVKEKCAATQTQIETLDRKLENTPVPSINAQTIYPNTIIKFGATEKVVKEKLNHVRITVDGEKICMGKY
ncbi:MAG TPA: hypothetical protein DCO75_04460 [Fibrobacteres bacterium]|nr:hypothetical protein [Fibrobacterota bacterium]